MVAQSVFIAGILASVGVSVGVSLGVFWYLSRRILSDFRVDLEDFIQDQASIEEARMYQERSVEARKLNQAEDMVNAGLLDSPLGAVLGYVLSEEDMEWLDENPAALTGVVKKWAPVIEPFMPYIEKFLVEREVTSKTIDYDML